MYQGMMFHETVRGLGKPTSVFRQKFLAVSSGLLREMKPLFTAPGPAASKRKRQAELVPPSSGSKIRGLGCETFCLTNRVYKFVQGGDMRLPDAGQLGETMLLEQSDLGRSI